MTSSKSLIIKSLTIFREFVMEVWKDAVGFEGYYVVSSLGRVMRVSGKTTGHVRKSSNNQCGYRQMLLSMNGKYYTVRVHRLVAEAFIGPVPVGYEVNHKDGDKNNNRADNLEYITHIENMSHAMKVLHKQPAIGVHHGRSKLSEEDVRNIRRLLADGVSRRKIGFVYGVSGVAITLIANGRTWTHVK